MKRLAIIFLLCGAAFGAATISPTSYSPASLSYDDATNTPTQVFTIAGFTGTCTISILDDRGNVVTGDAQYGTLSSTSQACTTATFAYNAPFNYPTGTGAQVRVTDGTLTATATINFSGKFWCANNTCLKAFYQRQGRTLKFDTTYAQSSLYMNEPSSAAGNSRYLIAKTSTGSEMHIFWPPAGISGMQFPYTAGSNVDIPFWSYNGQYISYQDSACFVGVFCGSSATNIFRTMNADGTGTLVSKCGQGSTTSCTWDYRVPWWILATSANSSTFYVANGHNNWTTTTIFTYNGGAACGSACLLFNGPPMPQRFDGKSFELTATANASSGSCVPPNVGCSPTVSVYDLSGVENARNGNDDPTTLLTAAYTWSIFKNIQPDTPQSGDFRVELNQSGLQCTENGGDPHCVNEEFEMHSIGLGPDGNSVGFSYGPKLSAGEYLSIGCNLDGTNCLPTYSRAFTNTPQYSHPVTSRVNSNVSAFQGPLTCGDNNPGTVGAGASFDFNTAAGANHACKYGSTAAPEWVIYRNTGKPIQSCDLSSVVGNGTSTVTVTTKADCSQLTTGQLIQIIGVGTPFTQGTNYTATVTDTTHFTYTDGNNPSGTVNNKGYVALAVAANEKHDSWIDSNIGFFFMDLDDGNTPNNMIAVTVNVAPKQSPVQTVLHTWPRANGGGSFSKFTGPICSADGTKCAEAWAVASAHRCSTTAYQCLPQLGWVGVTYKPVAPPRLSLSGSAIQWRFSELNHETQDYWIWKQPSCAGAWSEVAKVNSDYINTFLLQGTYSYTLADLGSGSTACYAVTAHEYSNLMSDTTSKTISVTNTAGVYSQNSVGPEITNFDVGTPNAVTAMAVSQTLIPAPATIALTTATSGGSIATGTVWAKVVYCNYTDFPANTSGNLQCSAPSGVQSIAVTGPSATVTVKNNGSNVVGQWFAGVYACANATDCSATTSTLQTCATINGAANSNTTFAVPYYSGDNLGRFTCVLTSLATGGTGVPAGGTAVQSYNITWTASSSVDARYNAIYSCDSAICPNARDIQSMTPYLIATTPASATSWIDWLPNPALASTNVHYEVAVVNYGDKVSAGVCFRGDGTSETCGP